MDQRNLQNEFTPIASDDVDTFLELLQNYIKCIEQNTSQDGTFVEEARRANRDNPLLPPIGVKSHNGQHNVTPVLSDALASLTNYQSSHDLKENPSLAQRVFKLLYANKNLTEQLKTMRIDYEMKIKALNEQIRELEKDCRSLRDKSERDSVVEVNTVGSQTTKLSVQDIGVTANECEELESKHVLIYQENETLRKKVGVLEEIYDAQLQNISSIQRRLEESERACGMYQKDLESLKMKCKYLARENNQVKSLTEFLEDNIQEQIAMKEEDMSKTIDLVEQIQNEKADTRSREARYFNMNVSMRKMHMDKDRLETEIQCAHEELKKTKALLMESEERVSRMKDEEILQRRQIEHLQKTISRLKFDGEKLVDENSRLTKNSEKLKLQVETWKVSYQRESATKEGLESDVRKLERDLKLQQTNVQRLLGERERIEFTVKQLEAEILSQNNAFKTKQVQVEKALKENLELAERLETFKRMEREMADGLADAKDGRQMLDRRNKQQRDKQHSNALHTEVFKGDDVGEGSVTLTPENRQDASSTKALEQITKLYEEEKAVNKRLSDEMSILNQEIRLHYQQKDQLSEELQSASENIAKLTVAADELRSSYEKVAEENQSLIRLNDELSEAKEVHSKEKSNRKQNSKRLTTRLKETNKQMELDQKRRARLEDEKHKISADNAKLRTQMKSFEDKNAKLRNTVNDLNEQMRKDELEKSTLKGEIEMLRKQTKRDDGMVSSLTADLQEANASLENSCRRMEEQEMKIEEMKRILATKARDQTLAESDELTQLRTENDIAKGAIKTLERQKKKLETENKQLSVKLSKANNRATENDRKYKEMKKDFDAATEALRVQKERAQRLLSETNRDRDESRETRRKQLVKTVKKRETRSQADADNIQHLQAKLLRSETEIERLKSSNQGNATTIKKLEGEVSKLHQLKCQAENEVKEVKKEMALLELKFAEIAKQNQEQTERLNAKGSQKKELQETMEKQKKEVQVAMEEQQKRFVEEVHDIKQQCEKQVEVAEAKAKELEGKFKESEEKLQKITSQIDKGRELYRKSKETIGQLNEQKHKLKGVIRLLKNSATTDEVSTTQSKETVSMVVKDDEEHKLVGVVRLLRNSATSSELNVKKPNENVSSEIENDVSTD